MKKIFKFKEWFYPRLNKPNNYFDRLESSIHINLQSPEMIEWFPSPQCNAKCLYCSSDTDPGTSQAIIALPQMIEIIQSLSSQGIKVWNIGGRWGEPLLYPQLLDILKTIKTAKLYGILITNGLLLNEKFIEELAAIKWELLKISLDSHRKEIHDKIRGSQGSFAQIDSSLKFLKKLKQKQKFPYSLCCPVITNQTYLYLHEYIEYCIENQVDEIEFMPIHNIGVNNNAQKFLLSNEEIKEFLKLAKKKIKESRIKHNLHFIINHYEQKTTKTEPVYNSRNLYCIHLWKTLVISEEGHLCPCSAIKDISFKVTGNDYLGAWKSTEMNKLRQKILKGEFIEPGACKECCGPLRNETLKFNRYLDSKN